MEKKAREKVCDYCGEPLGYPHTRELDHCGERECAREVAAMERDDYEERAERARDDDYVRY